MALHAAPDYSARMYRIELAQEAAKALQRMPRTTAKLIWSKIQHLAEDPDAPSSNVKRLLGQNAYRLRVGDWRVLHRLESETLVVLVLRIRPRSSAHD